MSQELHWLFFCRCAKHQRTTVVMTGSWVCVCAESLLAELHVEAYAGRSQLHI